MRAEVSRIDVEAIERLSDAAMRSGDTQTAIEGYALSLRLRATLGFWKEPEPDEDERPRFGVIHGG